MKMGWGVVQVVHEDADSEEAADLGHGWVPRRCAAPRTDPSGDRSHTNRDRSEFRSTALRLAPRIHCTSSARATRCGEASGQAAPTLLREEIVEELGGEVGPVGPSQRAVDLESREVARIVQRLEDLSSELAAEVDLALEPVLEA